jgi:hypothetical protein
MKLKALQFLLFIFISCLSKAQTNAGDTLVKWDAKNKISWSDFTIKDTTNRYAAECLTFFKANFYLKNDSVFCQVIAYLNADRSWRKPDLQTDGSYAINHEQKHFDITEIFARKIRKELINSTANEQEVQNIYFSNAKACRDFQDLYDKETLHSLQKANQDVWDKKISDLLASLEPYKEKAIYIKKPWCKLCWRHSAALASP